MLKPKLDSCAVADVADAFSALALGMIRSADPQWTGEGKKYEDLVAFEESQVWEAFCKEYPDDWQKVRKSMYRRFAKKYCHDYLKRG